MAFKNFRIQVIFRAVLIGLVLFGFVLAIQQDQWYVTSGSLLIIAVFLVAEMIRHVEKTRREISSFLVSVDLKDFTSVAELERKTDRKNRDLTDAFKYIAGEFQNVRIEKEMHYQYLQTVFGHVDTAMICFNDKGKIELINKAARELLNVHSLQSRDYLKRSRPEIGFILEQIKSGEQKLLKIKLEGVLMQLSIRAAEFILRDKKYKLISLQDIKNELEGRELESWQKLIRVLTHEIMNSVTPISSLSQAIKDSMEDEEGNTLALKDLDSADLQDIHDSILTIEGRSRGLLQFVNTYRNLSKLPVPEFEKISLKPLFDHIKSLMGPELEKDNISLSIAESLQELSIYADHDMIVRVLINLISNARDALLNTSGPEIKIHVHTDSKNRINIIVEDNGFGMDPETQENIFIPFFTTKEKGSGIGLSLCRQIMHLHKGIITAESEEGTGTKISLRF